MVSPEFPSLTDMSGEELDQYIEQMRAGRLRVGPVPVSAKAPSSKKKRPTKKQAQLSLADLADILPPSDGVEEEDNE